MAAIGGNANGAVGLRSAATVSTKTTANSLLTCQGCYRAGRVKSQFKVPPRGNRKYFIQRSGSGSLSVSGSKKFKKTIAIPIATPTPMFSHFGSGAPSRTSVIA